MGVIPSLRKFGFGETLKTFYSVCIKETNVCKKNSKNIGNSQIHR
jgi:hypothetical protein